MWDIVINMFKQIIIILTDVLISFLEHVAVGDESHCVYWVMDVR